MKTNRRSYRVPSQKKMTERLMRYYQEHPEIMTGLQALSQDPDLRALGDEGKTILASFLVTAGPRLLAAVDRLGVDVNDVMLHILFEDPSTLTDEERASALVQLAQIRSVLADPMPHLGGLFHGTAHNEEARSPAEL